MGSCKKKRFRRAIDAKIALAFMRDNPKRKEKRFYWHDECRAYHLTKMEYKWWETSGEQHGGSTPGSKSESLTAMKAVTVPPLVAARTTSCARGWIAAMTA